MKRRIKKIDSYEDDDVRIIYLADADNPASYCEAHITYKNRSLKKHDHA